MPNGDDVPPGPTDSDEWAEINDSLFKERIQLFEAERKLASRQGKRPTPELEKQIRQTRLRLEQVTEEILQTNRGLVVKCVSRFARLATPEEKSQYVAAGVVGLYEAVESYDVASGKFATWAYWPVLRSVLGAVNEVEHPSLGERDFGMRKPVFGAFEQLQGPAGELTPTIDEVAALSGATPAQVERIMLAKSSKGIGETWEERLAAKQVASIFDEVPPDPVVVDNAHERLMKEMFDCLTMQEVLVLMRHEGLDGSPPENFEAIGKWLGISREKARLTNARALETLKTHGWEISDLWA
jgi:RNA polymerase sigma factor (sigma-70 family)